MKLYTPVFRCMIGYGKWEIEEIDSEDLRYRINKSRVCRWKKSVGYYGDIYLPDSFFITKDAAKAYIRKEYIPEELRFNDFKMPERGF